jgi:hypothetical protein
MHFSKLSPSKPLIVTSDITTIRNALVAHLDLVRASAFADLEAIDGAPRSGRILRAVPRVYAQPPVQLCANQVCEKLRQLAEGKARYFPQPTPEYRKGWELRSMRDDGTIALIAWAAWVL